MSTNKRLSIHPWRDAPFQQQFQPLRSAYDRTKDLYLTSGDSHDGLTEYQIKNDGQELILYAKCKTDNKIPRWVDIFSPEANRIILEAKELKPFWYSVRQGESLTGSLVVQKDQFCFLDPHERIILRAISYAGGVWEEKIVDLENIPGLYYKTETHLSITTENGKELGKYYRALHNLDLRQDTKLQLDRSIAVAVAVLFEEHIRILPPRPAVYR